MTSRALRTLSNNIGNEPTTSSSLTAPTKSSEGRSRTKSIELYSGPHQSEGDVRGRPVKEVVCHKRSLVTMSTEDAEVMHIKQMKREFEAQRGRNQQIMESSQRRPIPPPSYSEQLLTVPTSPNMQTSARLGGKNYAIQGSMAEPVIQSPPHPICPKRCKSNSETPPLSLTVPEAFHLHTEDRFGRSPSIHSHKPAAINGKAAVKLGDSNLNHQLNKSAKGGIRPLTIPIAPQLATEKRKRSHIMSSDEKDQMIMDEARHHPFRARPVPRSGLCGEQGLSLVHDKKRRKPTTTRQSLPSRRKLTMPQSPNLYTKKRGSIHKDTQLRHLSEPSENVLFKAIELPTTTYVPETLVKPDVIPSTDPQEFESKVAARVVARATWEEGNKARIEAEKQKKEMKDAKRVEEMNQLRNLPASEGGFMFKAREFERGIESNPRKTVPVHSSKPPLTQPQTPKFATNTRSRCCPK